MASITVSPAQMSWEARDGTVTTGEVHIQPNVIGAIRFAGVSNAWMTNPLNHVWLDVTVDGAHDDANFSIWLENSITSASLTASPSLQSRQRTRSHRDMYRIGTGAGTVRMPNLYDPFAELRHWHTPAGTVDFTVLIYGDSSNAGNYTADVADFRITNATLYIDDHSGGSDIYVDAAAGAGGNGSIGSPYNAIGAALAVATPNDTILLAPGTYTDLSGVYTDGGDFTGYIRIEAQDPTNRPIIDGGDLSNATIVKFHNNSHLGFANVIFEYIGLQIGEQATMGTNTFDNVYFEDCLFRHSYRSQVHVFDGDNIRVSRSTMYDIRQRTAGSDQSAIKAIAQCNDLLISWNKFFDIGSDPIQIREEESGYTVRDVSIYHNYFGVSRGSNHTTYGTAIRPWQDFSTNVSENGLDIKTLRGPVQVCDNRFYGFRKTVAGQDASGALGSCIDIHSSGFEGIVSPASFIPVFVRRNMFEYSDRGVQITDRSEYRCVIEDNVFRNITDGAAFRATEGKHRVNRNTFSDIGNAVSASIVLAQNVEIWSWHRNLFRNIAQTNVNGNGSGVPGIQTGTNAQSQNAYFNITSQDADLNHASNVPITTEAIDAATLIPDSATSDYHAAGTASNTWEFDFYGLRRDDVSTSIGAKEDWDFSDANDVARLNPDHRTRATYVATDANGSIVSAPNAPDAYRWGWLLFKDDGTDGYLQTTFANQSEVSVVTPFQNYDFSIASSSLVFLFVDNNGAAVARSRTRGIDFDISLVLDAGGFTNGSYTSYTRLVRYLYEANYIAATAPGANNGAATLTLDATTFSSLSGIDNDTRVFNEIQIGLQTAATTPNGHIMFGAVVVTNGSAATLYPVVSDITPPTATLPSTGVLPLIKIGQFGKALIRTKL